MRHSNKGFTLIELLVVIAIIGILASVVLASLSTARQNSRNAATVAGVKEVEKALQLYWVNNDGRYPDTTAQPTGLACIGSYSDGMCWNGNNVNVVPAINTAMAPYLDLTAVQIPYRGGSVEGMVFGSRTSLQGYELRYVLEGADHDCPVGKWGWNANSGAASVCIVCNNSTTGSCAP